MDSIIVPLTDGRNIKLNVNSLCKRLNMTRSEFQQAINGKFDQVMKERTPEALAKAAAQVINEKEVAFISEAQAMAGDIGKMQRYVQKFTQSPEKHSNGLIEPFRVIQPIQLL